MTVPLQQQLGSFWNHQSTSQKITLVALVVAAAVVIPLIRFLGDNTQLRGSF